MSAYCHTAFYAAHYDTPTGSRYVEPGEIVEWPDGPPDGWWTPASGDGQRDEEQSGDEHGEDQTPGNEPDQHADPQAAPIPQE